jgi:hypothetical protein
MICENTKNPGSRMSRGFILWEMEEEELVLEREWINGNFYQTGFRFVFYIFPQADTTWRGRFLISALLPRYCRSSPSARFE